MTAKPPAILDEAPTLGHWVRIDPDGGIRLLTGKVELGQGSLTALLQIAADELHCAVDSLRITPAHTGLTPNEGLTAGSVSISAGGVAMRWAASALRVALLRLAAQKSNVGVADLALADHRIFGRTKDRVLFAVADIVGQVDLSQPVADLAAPKPPADRWARGRDVGRVDLRARMVGAPFLQDLAPPDLLFGQPVHPPARTARLVSIDLDALRGRPGVVDVVRDGSFLGVIADSAIAATRAVRWARQNGTWDGGSRDPRDEIGHIATSRAPAETTLAKGDFATAPGREIAATVTRPYLLHGAIGPASAMARWDGERVTVWSHSQGVFQLRDAIAQVIGADTDRVEVIHHPGAGCYGHNGADDAALDAVLLARSVPGRPVKVVWSRLDELRSEPMGPGMATHVTAKIDDTGKITAMRVVANTAPHANRPGKHGAPNLLAGHLLAKPFPPAPSTDLPLARGGGGDRNAVPGYDIPHVEVVKRLVHDLPHRTSSLRGLGAFLNVFAIETMMDDIAAELGEGPAAFRLRHLADTRARAVIEEVAELAAGIDAPGGEGIGWGLGYARYKGNSGYCAVMARVEAGEDIRVTHAVSVSDIGEVVSPDGALNQIEGGIVQATSWTLKERVPFEGDFVTAESWLDYPILRFSEVPQIEARLIERMDEPALGAGEISQGPTAAAIGNALFHAMGVRVRHLPLNREAILRALG